MQPCVCIHPCRWTMKKFVVNLVNRSLGSPLIDGIFLVQKMCIYSCVTLQLYWLRAVQFNARSACDTSMFTSCIYKIYIFLRLASKCLNCTRSPEEIVQKLHKYDWKHKKNSLEIDSDNFTKLPVTFLVENNHENRVKFAKFLNILLNFSLWLCVVQVAWHNFKRFSRSNDDGKISLAFEISKCQATWTTHSHSEKFNKMLKILVKLCGNTT